MSTSKTTVLCPARPLKHEAHRWRCTRALELGVESFVMPTAGNAGGAWSAYATCGRSADHGLHVAYRPRVQPSEK